MGRDAGEVSLEVQEWVETTHHEDRAAIMSMLDEVRANVVSDVQVFYRQHMDDGSYRWFQALGTVIERDSAGLPLHLIGVIADIHATRQATEAAARRAAEAELLAAAGARLLNCQDAECVFGVVHDFFAATFPNDIVVVNEVTADGEALAMREIIGVTPALIARAEHIIGNLVVGHRYPLTPAYRSILMSGRMECVEGGLAAAAAGQISETVIRALEDLLGLHEFWSVGLADAGEARAGVHVLTRRSDAEVPVGVVEAFAHLCFVTLARLEAVDRLAESEARFRTLVETAPEAIYVQTDLRFVFVNHEAYRLYGARSPDDLIGQPIMDRFRSDYRDTILSRIKATQADPTPRRGMASVHLRLDGSEIPVEVSSAPIVYAGRAGAVVFVRDVTEARNAAQEIARHRDHLEDLVAERTRELERANTDLERATQAKSAFLARMSHEFRTPLNSIIGFSTVLMEGITGPLGDEQRDQVGLINASGRHLLEIISDLLDISRVEAGRTRMDVREMDPAAVVSEVAEVLRPLAAEKRLEMRVRVPAEAPLIRSDAGKVRQILLNLGGNAVKFTETGYVELGLDTGDNDTVVFSVRDTGRGIRNDLLAHIFESFTQGDTPADDVPRGTGLGLTISREYARLLRGDVAVTSAPGKGSTFTLTLPANLA
jgi:PAS domain S-box-containing protein